MQRGNVVLGLIIVLAILTMFIVLVHSVKGWACHLGDRNEIPNVNASTSMQRQA